MIFFPFGKIFVAHHKKNLPAFFKVYIDHLFDNLESGIRKSLEKVFNSGTKNLYEPCP